MILTQGILDELKNQAEIQGKKNYRGVEIDYRVVLAMCSEIEESRKQKIASLASLERFPEGVLQISH